LIATPLTVATVPFGSADDDATLDWVAAGGVGVLCPTTKLVEGSDIGDDDGCDPDSDIFGTDDGCMFSDSNGALAKLPRWRK